MSNSPHVSLSLSRSLLSLVSARARESLWLEGLKIHFLFFLAGFRGPFGLLAAAAAAAAAGDRFLPTSTAQTSAAQPNAKFTLGFHYL